MSYEFEWDENKRLLNIYKHSVDFEFAARMFNGPVLVRVDDRKNYGETRFNALGAVNGMVLNVTYTERRDRIRIISAWIGGQYEHEIYYESIA